MGPHEFFELGFAEVCLMIGGYDDRLKDDWKQTREIAYMIYCLGTEPNNRHNKTKFMPLPGDGEADWKKLTAKEMIQASKDKWKQIDEKRKNKAK